MFLLVPTFQNPDYPIHVDTTWIMVYAFINQLEFAKIPSYFEFQFIYYFVTTFEEKLVSYRSSNGMALHVDVIYCLTPGVILSLSYNTFASI